MFTVDTVYVLATSRGTYPIEDLVRSLRWSSLSSHYTVIVDRNNKINMPDDLKDGYTILRVEGQKAKVQDQFIAGMGIKWCLDQQIAAKQFVLLDDRCLITQKGADSWALEHMEKTGMGFIGVRDRLNYEDAYSKMTPYFDMWDLPHAQFIPGPETVHEAVLFISQPLAAAFYEKNLWSGEGVDQWPLPYGPYISWIAQMLGYFQVAWGAMDDPMFPLFVCPPAKSRMQLAPHVLSSQFRVYFSAQHVLGYSEEHVREMFKKVRGEPVSPREPMRPSVSPRRTGPTEEG